jgi:hypothetical protein
VPFQDDPQWDEPTNVRLLEPLRSSRSLVG